MEGNKADLNKEPQANIFLTGAVEKGGYGTIEIRFETLIHAYCKKPSEWYNDLGLDKSYASKVRRGLIIPPRWMRIKIAQYFNTDSATIWSVGEIVSAKELLEQEEKKDD